MAVYAIALKGKLPFYIQKTLYFPLLTVLCEYNLLPMFILFMTW